MENLDKALDTLSSNIKRYRTMEVTDGNTLNEILQQITGTLFYLEKQRSEFHHAFEVQISEGVANGLSVARATNESNVKYPEMYLLRRIMDSGYEVAGAIRTNISWLKSERHNV